MIRVIFDISMSLDGFVTASNVRPEEPLGDGGQRLHEWAFGEEANARVGAFVMGRRMFDEGEVGLTHLPSVPRPSSSRTAPGNPGSGREERPPPSSPAASKAPWSKRGRPQTTRT